MPEVALASQPVNAPPKLKSPVPGPLPLKLQARSLGTRPRAQKGGGASVSPVRKAMATGGYGQISSTRSIERTQRPSGEELGEGLQRAIEEIDSLKRAEKEKRA